MKEGMLFFSGMRCLCGQPGKVSCVKGKTITFVTGKEINVSAALADVRCAVNKVVISSMATVVLAV